MTCPALDVSVSSGLPSLEVRWIRPGELDVRMLEWFGRFPTVVESREDNYLISPDLAGLSVKIRGDLALEVKVYHGRLGVLDVPGRARGRMEFWQRWSFPLGSPIHGIGAAATWRSVRKIRRMSFFSLDEGQLSAGVPGPQQVTGCAVELTEVNMRGGSWWTLGFEAIGPHDGLRSLVQATAALVFDQAMADGLELTSEDSGSYVSWLRGRHGSDQPTDLMGDRPGRLLRDRADNDVT
jgi:hypothetical protein